ncbi:hypothetical protein PC9H_008737 [Pleurotus ostreatus]|uniref:AB hydrolase-1 domain-containing protein n=2 Tax=Pleurotus TaxID=5320 RepID=A0A8H6ZS73_PLEOS|nr:uncharacterized protein PC9H_008737 [Pleurotus ostreatus]KAF7426369.1 hypothetical protein PC9H_008737 [Pleurotus ostreatus]KAG9221884.1 hypothetical protein CCMSSC00406_0005709 [Pleurotus cornucopiae]
MAAFPPGISSRIVQTAELDVHILEALPPNGVSPKPPLLLLLHGFPELAYSWRKVILPLAAAGYHVVAPDQRGYGRTTPARTGDSASPSIIKYTDDLSPYRMLNLVKDIVALIHALGYPFASAVIGHDFGSNVAGFCAIIRPDLFKSAVMMSAPCTGAPPLITNRSRASSESVPQMADRLLSRLTTPRKHYTMYYSSAEANDDMMNAPGGLHAFLRAYYHVKSADWEGNNPYKLPAMSAEAVAVMPHYYIMPLDSTMPECVVKHAPQNSSENTWLPDSELAYYTGEFARTGFQGGLNWYRCMTDVRWMDDLLVFSGKQIEVPAMFISGRKDWGTYQVPGAVEAMKEKVCRHMANEDFVLVDGAGHWVQQEQPEAVIEEVLRFLTKVL